MAAEEEPKVGSKRSREEPGDDDAEKKVAKEEETKVTEDAAGKEKTEDELGKVDEGSDKKSDEAEPAKVDKPSTSLFGSASAGGGFGGSPSPSHDRSP